MRPNSVECLTIAGLGVSSVAFSFLNCYTNAAHEERAFALAKERRVAPYISASNRVSNEYREYERTSTVVVNAVLMPIINRYLTQLGEDLRGWGSRRCSM